MLKIALDKMNVTENREEGAEQKYMFFELGFMPIIMYHCEDQEFFEKMVQARILDLFFQTFFVF